MALQSNLGSGNAHPSPIYHTDIEEATQGLANMVFEAAVLEDQPISICKHCTTSTTVPMPLPSTAKIWPSYRHLYLSRNTFVIDARDDRDNRTVREWMSQLGGVAYWHSLRSLILRGRAYNLTGEIIVDIHMQLAQQQQGAVPVTATIMPSVTQPIDRQCPSTTFWCSRAILGAGTSGSSLDTLFFCAAGGESSEV
ncbi:hypothetical protein NA57DRAFT_82082 [Rhizodiscina lignyota]|uniref:Uncharacterized protein n=1 Tax=Rhizodiscina lignyota TaxID=1504668 RepID=A0A9P4I3A9_9PEZI|nr:hypothetical protein NA57DRAFT_82082 [Rhizodiscina lignyota]